MKTIDQVALVVSSDCSEGLGGTPTATMLETDNPRREETEKGKKSRYYRGWDWGTPENFVASEGSEESSDSKSWFRKRPPTTLTILQSPQHLRKPDVKGQKFNGKRRKGQWTDEALEMAIDGLDQGFSMAEVSRKYKIPRSFLRNHYEHRTKGRKMEPKTILIKEDEGKLVEYIELMVHWGHPMTPMQVKNKVAEITQERETPFTRGIPRKSWLKLFRSKHP